MTEPNLQFPAVFYENLRFSANPKKNLLRLFPNLPILAFCDFLAFSFARNSLLFERFPLLSQEFQGVGGEKNPCFFGGFPCFLPKKQGKEDQGCLPQELFNFWGHAKGAAKGSCGETVVQKGVFGESVSSLLP